MHRPRRFLLTSLGLALAAACLPADQATHGDEIRIRRATGPIRVDGDLSDPGWKGATKITTWYETNPGDNVEPKVKNVGYLTYDDKYFYAAFEFFDPDPGQIRAPFGDRDNVPSYTDYGGIILDTRNDGKTGILLLANPRGIQYDAVTAVQFTPSRTFSLVSLDGFVGQDVDFANADGKRPALARQPAVVPEALLRLPALTPSPSGIASQDVREASQPCRRCVWK